MKANREYNIDIVYLLIENGAAVTGLDPSLCKHFGNDFVDLHQVSRWMPRRNWLIFLSSSKYFSGDDSLVGGFKGHCSRISPPRCALLTLLNIVEMNRFLCEYL